MVKWNACICDRGEFKELLPTVQPPLGLLALPIRFASLEKQSETG